MSKNPTTKTRTPSKRAIRTKTEGEVIQKLNTNGKCFLIRPTGYGKTYFLANLTKHYNRVLYLCPNVTIIEKVLDILTKRAHLTKKERKVLSKTRVYNQVTLMTFQKLIRNVQKGNMPTDYDLIIMDEAHKIGGPKTKDAITWLMNTNPSAKFIGATATANRSDSLDIIGSFFSGIMASSYTLHDAFQDGFLQQPHYFCGVSDTDIAEDMKEAALTAGLDPKNPAIKKVLKRKAFEISDLYNMETIIQKACSKYVKDTTYMKYIVFFPTIAQMHETKKEVASWFQKAFPTHRINTICVSSQNTVEHDINLNKIKHIRRKKNAIDLICCVDMLSEGEHFKNLTGIMMYRVTYSSIKFNQQLGRALSSDSKHQALVFDVVDNLHRRGIFDLPITNPSKKKPTTKPASIKTTTPWMIDDDGNVVDENGNLAPFTMDDQGQIIDLNGNVTTMYVIPGTNLITTPPTPQAKMSLSMFGHEANYKEILAKSVAEIIHQDTRAALIIHFQAWCDANNIPNKSIEDMIRQLNAESKKQPSQRDFINSFSNLLKNKNLTYPLHDLQALTNYGTSGNTSQIPLVVCAKSRNVSVRAILDMILAGTSVISAKTATI